MEPTFRLVTDGGACSCLPGDRKTVLPDDGGWSAMILPSPSPTERAWEASSASMGPSAQTDQLSPVSAGIGLPLEGSFAPATAHSASSSCSDSWSNELADQDDEHEETPFDYLDQGSDAEPKLEPVDDDIDLSGVTLAPPTPSLLPSHIPSSPLVKQRRPRGRPRKTSLTAPLASPTKVTKGRSKTGCITCRKRKKKCDEAKPRCMNCEKNAVVCEGYHEKQLWRSGRDREEEERLRHECLPTSTMPPIIHGIEASEDRILWRHYVNHFSNVLTIEGEAKNAFKDVILQLASQHQGLMHSVLALSGKHIDLDSPYGARVLQSHGGTSVESVQRRAEYHHTEALKRLYEDLEKSMGKDDPDYQTMLAGRYGQILCLLLQTRADGNPRGEHRLHLQAYQSLIEQSPPEDTALSAFVVEFFQYHVYADDLFWHPATMTRRLSTESWEPPAPIEAPRLLGVADGLFKHLSQITSIRNAIRENMAALVEPPVDYVMLFRAVDIDAAIREWAPRWPPGDSRNRVAPLYRQMMWVYLFRTIYPPSPSPPSPPPPPPRRATLGAMPEAPPAPPQRRASAGSAGSAAAGGRWGVAAEQQGPPQPAADWATARRPSRTSSMHALDTRTAAAARPHDSDGRMALAVEESLSLLASFKASDPIQTLLLVPCLLIGTACFGRAQRERARAAVRRVRGYTGLRSCDRAMEVLDAVWALMDAGDWLAVWDWQGVARRMGLDFLCA